VRRRERAEGDGSVGDVLQQPLDEAGCL